MKKVTVIDYGAGNMLNVTRALEFIGCKVNVCDQFENFSETDYLVLPGVGAFPDSIKELRRRGLQEIIMNHIDQEKPFLGICLGMQMLLNHSHEFGQTSGFGIFEGEVKLIPHISSGIERKVPHIGWNKLEKGHMWNSSFLNGLDIDFTYFVHSFYADVAKEYLVASCNVDGFPIPAIIQNGNTIGCQFHPEKSSCYGLNILKKFLEV